MHTALPHFALKESASRSVSDEAKPSAKPVKFAWSPIDKLAFSFGFTAAGKQDAFDALFYWSGKGKIGGNGAETLDYPFPEKTYELADAAVMLQTISAAVGDKPRVFTWSFWEPTRESGSTRESHAAYLDEFIAEELRVVVDEEA